MPAFGFDREEEFRRVVAGALRGEQLQKDQAGLKPTFDAYRTGDCHVRITGPTTISIGPTPLYPAVVCFRNLAETSPADRWIDAEPIMAFHEDIAATLTQDRVYSARMYEKKEVAGTKYMLAMITEGKGSDTAPPPAPCGGCGWFAGATEYDCWTLTVVGAGGNMDSVSTSQELSLSWVADVGYPDGGYWVSDEDFTICGAGPVRLWRNEDGEPQLTFYGIDPPYTMTLSCCVAEIQTLYFSGGNSGMTALCCVPQVEGGPKENLFTVAVAWVRCPIIPNPDYSTPGWYCVAQSTCSGTRMCCNLTEDPGIGVLICSGPHASEEACNALCDPPDTVPVVCGELDTNISSVLFAVWGNGTTTTLTYDAGYIAGPSWVSPDFDYEGYSLYIWVTYTCDEETGVISWALGVGSHSDTCAEGAAAYSIAYAPFVGVFTGIQPLLSCGVPSSVIDSLFVSE